MRTTVLYSHTYWWAHKHTHTHTHAQTHTHTNTHTHTHRHTHTHTHTELTCKWSHEYTLCMPCSQEHSVKLFLFVSLLTLPLFTNTPTSFCTFFLWLFCLSRCSVSVRTLLFNSSHEWKPGMRGRQDWVMLSYMWWALISEIGFFHVLSSPLINSLVTFFCVFPFN